MASRENARRFHFLREIASGGFGTVYLCKVVHADGFSRLAAVKLLKTQWRDSDEVVKRIRDEARLLGLLRHRNIITVSDLTSIDGRTAVVMEYVEGVDLRTVVRAMADAGQHVPVRAVLEIASAAAGALDAAYNRPPMPGEKPLRVIHRDIKPSNIMIDEQGEVKVLDFGVARSDLADRESNTAELQFGSVDYMAPERLFFEPEKPAGDVYALGATIYELLALDKLGKAKGRPEQHAAAIEDRLSFMRAVMPVRGTVASELTELIRSCVAFEHERRPTAAEVNQRCRALTGLVDSEDLRPWSERVIPPLVKDAVANPPVGVGLTDSVRTEDSISRGYTGELMPPVSAALGAQVRRGALLELEDSTGRQVPPDAPARGVPRTPMPTMVPEPDASDAWNDEPTYVGPPRGDPTALPEPAGAALGAGELPPRPAPQAHIDDPAYVDLPGPRPVDNGPMMIAPATGAPAGASPRGRDDSQIDIGPGYDAEPTEFDPEETTSNLSGQDLAASWQTDTGRTDTEEAGTGPADDAAWQTPGWQTPPGGHLDQADDDGGGQRMAVILGGMAGGCLLLVLTSGLLAAGGVMWARSGGQLPGLASTGAGDVEIAIVDAEMPDEGALDGAVDDPGAPPDSEPLAVATASLVFESLAPDTRKLNVRCTGGDAKGSNRAEVDLATAERCMVTAIMQDRDRLVAVVDQAEAGTYACFPDGEELCERQ